MLRIREIEAESQFYEQVSVEVMSQIIPLSEMEAVVRESGKQEKRRRKMPAVLTLVLVIAMNWFSEVSQQYALVRLVQGIRLLTGIGVADLSGKSGISRARYRLGVEPLERLFRRICRPLATPETRGAFLYGLRVMAIDGTIEDMADTPENRAHFGGSVTHKGDGAFPQVQCVHLCECGTHAIVDTTFGPYTLCEIDGAEVLLRSIVAGMLVMLDQGLYRYDLITGIAQRRAHVLMRVQSCIATHRVKRLPDGTYLAKIYPPERARRRAGEYLMVRIIEYTIDDPKRPGHRKVHRILTTLLDPLTYPAIDLVVHYHERWEVEITIDEIDTHQRLSSRPLRSLKPAGVIQELYGLLLAHYVIRAIMHQAAQSYDLDPDRLSFVNSVRLICDAIPSFQITHPLVHPFLWDTLFEDMVAFCLPPRENRINPRVVKRKMSNFKRKRSQHLHPPNPKPFRDSVLLLRGANCA